MGRRGGGPWKSGPQSPERRREQGQQQGVSQGSRQVKTRHLSLVKEKIHMAEEAGAISHAPAASRLDASASAQSSSSPMSTADTSMYGSHTVKPRPIRSMAVRRMVLWGGSLGLGGCSSKKVSALPANDRNVGIRVKNPSESWIHVQRSGPHWEFLSQGEQREECRKTQTKHVWHVKVADHFPSRDKFFSATFFTAKNERGAITVQEFYRLKKILCELRKVFLAEDTEKRALASAGCEEQQDNQLPESEAVGHLSASSSPCQTLRRFNFSAKLGPNDPKQHDGDALIYSDINPHPTKLTLLRFTIQYYRV
ncbi:hypothetical protein EYF80_036226 [Liparis tanakae]|uniref:Uncharacterized protein n=1 Tax=Liparis tanakae TaxID=230148 RepID=A0A4Z2GLB0_9TELE|nr:hypothetical protein EYF80_036226 [Liparis tanakae]